MSEVHLHLTQINARCAEAHNNLGVINKDLGNLPKALQVPSMPLPAYLFCSSQPPQKLSTLEYERDQWSLCIHKLTNSGGGLT